MDVHGFHAVKNEVPVDAFELLDEWHEFANGGGEHPVQPGLLARVTGLGRFEIFHEAVKFHLRAAERCVHSRTNDQAFFVVGQFVVGQFGVSLAFHRGEIFPGTAREVNRMSGLNF